MKIVLFFCTKRKDTNMTSNELHSREILIEFLMFELKISRKESQSQLAELEKFGLIEIKPNGQLYFKMV